MQRYPASRWNQLLVDAQRIDEQIKGQAPGSAWNALAQLTAQIAGVRLNLPSE
ncbi:DNA polymerase III subunit delta [compost metagenome]